MTALLASMHSLWRWTIKLSRNSRHSSMRFRCRRLWSFRPENRCIHTGLSKRQRCHCFAPFKRHWCSISAEILPVSTKAVSCVCRDSITARKNRSWWSASRFTRNEDTQEQLVERLPVSARSTRTTESAAAWRTERNRRCRSRMRFYQVLSGQCSCTF